MAMDSNNYQSTINVSTNADQLVSDQASYEGAGGALTKGSGNLLTDAAAIRTLFGNTVNSWTGDDADACRTEANGIADALEAAATAAGTSGSNATEAGTIMGETQAKNTALFG